MPNVIRHVAPVGITGGAGLPEFTMSPRFTLNVCQEGPGVNCSPALMSFEPPKSVFCHDSRVVETGPPGVP